RLESASAETLQDPRHYEHAKRWRSAAKNRTGREKQKGKYQIALPAENAGQPTGHRNYDGVGDKIGRKYPCDLVHPSVHAPLNMWKGDVDYTGIHFFYEGREHH